MSYLNNPAPTHKVGPVAAVIAIHVGLGFLLVSGLATEVVKIINTGPLPSTEYKDPLPPPPPPPADELPPEPTTAPKVYTPPVPSPLPPKPNFVDTTTELPDLSEVIRIPVPDTPKVAPPSPTPAPPAFDPIAARPRGNPAGWVGTNDYKSNWIRKGMEGTASFRLDIAANGRVTGCRITRSTGHSELDDATCRLIAQRARFEPAVNSSGAKTGGSYTSSIKWVVPD